ncbi:MAG: hypothetical protein JWN44_1541 [Myxococcales bacterium]|nr:hypothetical protein [Myxococcales bacterium]
MRKGDHSVRRIAAHGSVAHERREVLFEEITAALPEARVIDRMANDPTARIITFELLTEER